MLVGVQFMLGDVFGVPMTNWEGEVMRNSVLDFINIDELNSKTDTALGANKTSTLLDTFVGAATIGWDFFSLLTGTYIFTLLVFYGIPTIFVAAIVSVYGFLLIRAFIGIIRGN